jgi:hypothetical protein
MVAAERDYMARKTHRRVNQRSSYRPTTQWQGAEHGYQPPILPIVEACLADFFGHRLGCVDKSIQLTVDIGAMLLIDNTLSCSRQN